MSQGTEVSDFHKNINRNEMKFKVCNKTPTSDFTQASVALLESSTSSYT